MQPPQVVAVLDELLAQLGEQFGVRGRVERRQVVGRIDDAASEVVRPDAVDDRLREIGIVGPPHPRDQQHARVLLLCHLDRLRLAEQPKLLRRLRAERAGDAGEGGLALGEGLVSPGLIRRAISGRLLLLRSRAFTSCVNLSKSFWAAWYFSASVRSSASLVFPSAASLSPSFSSLAISAWTFGNSALAFFDSASGSLPRDS